MIRKSIAVSAAMAGLMSGCVSVPDGPSVMVMPGNGKNFDQFRTDDYVCRQFAHDQIGGKTAEQAAADSGVKTAAVSTVIGAAAGAAINGGQGAGVGAATGLAMGSLIGASAANASGGMLQHRYDIAYEQCMYTQGNQVPVAENAPSVHRHLRAYSPPPPPPPPSSAAYPMPPDYYPPPPPAR